MIPLKLQIKNFLSYGSELQTIDFEPYQLICLSGKNGHGKSALLDAITWALWGNARKISGTIKADEGLLRLGQSSMMAVLDFECNGKKYRVKREFAKTSSSKPYAALDFGMYTKENKLISLTEKKIRDTQSKIENTIHLSLDTFVNSAFLRQGQANEFSKKSPTDRKEIFAEILGLQQYEIVKNLAMDKVKQAIAEKESIIKFQEKIEIELQKKQEIHSKLETVVKNLLALVKREMEAYKNKENLEERKKKLSEDQKNYQIITFQCDQLIKKEKEKQTLLLEIRNEWKRVHKQQINLTEKPNAEKEKNSILEKINQYQQTLQKKLHLKEQYLKNKESLHTLEKAFYETYNETIQDKRIKLERLHLELSSKEKQFKDLLKNQCDKNQEKKQIAEEVKKLQDTVTLNAINKKELEKEQKQFDKRKEYYQKYGTQGNWVKKELDTLKQKHLLSQDDGNPSCPLCEQNLSASRKKFLKTKFIKQEKQLHHTFARLSKIIKSLKQKLIEQHDVIEKLKKAYEKNNLNEIQIKESEKRVHTLDKELETINLTLKKTQAKQKLICKDIEITTKELKNLEEDGKQKLQKNQQYIQIRKEILKAQNDITELKYDKDEHQKTVQKLKEIEKKIEAFETIKKQIDRQKERKKNIHELCNTLKEVKKQKKDLESKTTQYKHIENCKKDIAYTEEELNNKQKEMNKQKEILLLEKGSLENQIAKCKQLEHEHKEQTKVIDTLHKVIEDYQDIASATGKNGIQALLIENAIPEVEQEANNILGKLTNNQAQIFIESLRDLKKGGTKETLDIKISDTAGIRAYELFSGGEAFRIDFSLRIAISKLLARRAGTSLQTLIIDEGFGSQDEEGLTQIMESIYKIQDDFSKVIIVSHLNSMKDQFPVHFFIQKGPNGSHVKVIQQG